MPPMRSSSSARPTSTRSRKSPAIRLAPKKRWRTLEEVARRYPTSEYAVAAKRKIEIARDQLAGKEMEVGRWHLERREYTGAINRFKVVVTRYQTTRHVEEALLRLTEPIWRSASWTRRRPRRPCWAQFPGQPLVQGCLRSDAVARAAAEREQGLLDQPGIQAWVGARLSARFAVDPGQ